LRKSSAITSNNLAMTLRTDFALLKLVEKDMTQHHGDSMLSHLVFSELKTAEKQSLSVRLPFRKDHPPANTMKKGWGAIVTEALRRTYQSKEWLEKALELDRKRNTKLGTLGYLPPEVRDQIWEEILGIFWKGNRVLTDYDHKHLGGNEMLADEGFRYKGRHGHDGIGWWLDYGSCGNKYFFHYCQDTFGNAMTDILNVFLRKCHFRFSLPGSLLRSLDLFQKFPLPPLRITAQILSTVCIRRCGQICPRDCFCSVCRRQHDRRDAQICVCSSLEDDARWMKAFRRLPSNLASITFFCGDTLERRISKTGLRKTSTTLAGMNKAVIRNVPKAVTSVSFSQNTRLTQTQQAELKAVLKDVEK